VKNLIEGRKIKVNGMVISENVFFEIQDEILINDKVLKAKRDFTYIAFYKPKGIETTHNPEIKNNLLTVFHYPEKLNFAGRLDKESEGLLLLSNDGRFIQQLSDPLFEKEKEYLVTVNKPIVESFIREMSQGVNIVICRTKPCFVEQIEELNFRIILKEGKNRQIRRMCKVYGYSVVKLLRIRIDKIVLADLKPGEYRKFNKNDLLPNITSLNP
jgi:23S rRNA pseudouridine2604 synthase